MVHFWMSFWDIRCSKKFEGGRKIGVREVKRRGWEAGRAWDSCVMEIKGQGWCDSWGPWGVCSLQVGLGGWAGVLESRASLKRHSLGISPTEASWMNLEIKDLWGGTWFYAEAELTLESPTCESDGHMWVLAPSSLEMVEGLPVSPAQASSPRLPPSDHLWNFLFPPALD